VIPPAVEVTERESRELESALRRSIKGEVRFDAGSRALYASDLSMYRQVPIGVVIPSRVDDVIRTMAICHERKIPILGRGCGTSLAGQTCNTAVIVDFSKYLHGIIEMNPRRKCAWVEPGIINDDLRNAAEEYKLTFAPDPATHAYCTIGGMIGNNSCGVHSVMGGKTVDNVEELDILTYDGLRMTVGRTSEKELQSIIAKGGRRGEIYAKLKSIRDRYGDKIRERYPKIPRRVSGYNLDSLLPENDFHVAQALVGSEGTCVMVLGAKVTLMHSPPCRTWVVIAYPDLFRAGDHAAPIRDLDPIGLEGFDKHLIENEKRKGKQIEGLELLPEGSTWLLAEFGGESREESVAKAEAAIQQIRLHDRDHLGIHLLSRPEDYEKVVKIRESGVGASRVPGKEDSWPSWEDAAVAPEKLGDYLREFYELLDKHHYACTTYGHFGGGCIHTRITFDTKTTEGVKSYRDFMTEASYLVVRYGGSLSGEHGDGQARAEMLPIMFGSDLIQAFREFKSAWDPEWRMNPGKIVDPFPLDTNLRQGPDYKPKPVMTYFKFPEDHGSMAQATERCFGVGKCRGLDGGTMCPSFHATREEMHSTRGRTRLLFEMLRGDAIQDGWHDEHIKEALDLCLACKGCKGDCPVSIDVATYKAEFLAHYYETVRRPRTAYSMGQISRVAPLASRFPSLVNLATQTPGLSALAKAAAGLTQKRTIPRFPAESFKSWYRRKGERGKRPNDNRPTVLLWADTFNNYFFPHTSRAALEVLESAGYWVEIPERNLCCGRPLYDYGFLDQAKRNLQQILDSLRPQIEAGTPMVVLEPSCASVFRDEMKNLFPNDEDARRLRQQTFLLSEFLNRIAYRPPTLKRKALLHGHCHQKALFGMKEDQKLLRRMGVDAELLDSGCCGLAGSFGFEEKHYDISMKVGERVLLPKVRKAARDTLIVGDGFSCREQILHGTPRHALHMAEVIQMAMRQPIERRKYAETGFSQEPGPYPWLAIASGAGLLAAGGLLWLLTREKPKRAKPHSPNGAPSISPAASHAPLSPHRP
jgi:FAD/FMN-containing dehydrogenase/Fe-S oxidoreductase